MVETIPVKKLDTPYISLRIEDGIMYGKWKNIHITLPIARETVSERIRFSEGVSYPALIDASALKGGDKEAREYLAKEGSELIKAGALLVNSIFTKTLVNVFMLINKPPVPTKMFTDEEKAKEWLKQFI